ncbi:hypothetical protein [Vibrio diazotrophicus]|uniref:Uncharacterized protein n=1 Tax=Vibrio diazotrophicus TaxID=685 RepID=A0ABX4WC25_VIBDI|nr:hypothetical protein [Vibrio diazotrophicus]MCZ4374311.1 hypothetical protein [Vibrio diazotrophicus]PNI01499.1 hypothetical protein C1O25_08195 [Vibrio diazotrophicus]
MRSFKILMLLIVWTVGPPAFSETIDGMWCQKADGFGKRMLDQGYKRELSLPFGWGEYSSNVSHSISGSDVNSYDIKAKNQWALFTKINGQWVVYQGVTRTHLRDGKTESFVCQVKSGNNLVRH